MHRKLFGVDGMRGVANTDPMTVETAIAPQVFSELGSEVEAIVKTLAGKAKEGGR